jgi:hypothetical protein
MPCHRPAAIALACLAATACLPNLGPSTVPNARSSYNEVISRSNLEQVLLNLVRLRYRDAPYFLEVANVLTQYEVQGSARVGDAGWAGASDRWVGAGGVAAQVAERPTVTYQPLTGDAFVRSLVSPIPIAALNLMAGTGWSIERIFLCCVDEVNELRNAPGASGPTPDVLYDDVNFREGARLLRRLQKAGAVEFLRPSDSVPTGRIRLVRSRAIANPTDSIAYDRLVHYLKLKDGQHEFLIAQADDPRPDVLHLYVRSTLGVMFYMSQNVQVPKQHEERGLVTVTRSPEGTPIDWYEVTGGIFRVRSGKDAPESAYVMIRYRDHWFWVDDSDLESKTTIALLGFLQTLQSAGTPQSLAPLITVPAR